MHRERGLEYVKPDFVHLGFPSTSSADTDEISAILFRWILRTHCAGMLASLRKTSGRICVNACVPTLVARWCAWSKPKLVGQFVQQAFLR